MANWLNLRAWTKVLLTCALALAVIIPTIDTCICAADLNLDQPGVSTELTGITASSTVAAKTSPADEATGAPCIYCHCAHWLGLNRADQPAFGTIFFAARTAEAVLSVLSTAPPLELLRPPQA